MTHSLSIAATLTPIRLEMVIRTKPPLRGGFEGGANPRNGTSQILLSDPTLTSPHRRISTINRGNDSMAVIGVALMVVVIVRHGCSGLVFVFILIDILILTDTVPISTPLISNSTNS